MKENYIKKQKILYIIITVGVILLLLTNAFTWILLNQIKDYLVPGLHFSWVFSSLILFVILLTAFLIFYSSRKLYMLDNKIKHQLHLAKLGEMAASIAHEIRNSLGIIKGTNEIIQKNYAKVDDELFTYIPNELDRLNKIITDFLTFAHPPKINYQNVNLQGLLKKVTLGFSPDKNIKIIFNSDEKISSFKTSPNFLEQVILNILINSYQSIDNEGTITIHSQLKGNNVIMEISDNGSGISPKNLTRVFEPFFSTKAQGSGLGLTISKMLIEQLGGKIFLRSNKKRGTNVTIVLPYQKG
jgi:signal transduction histidine kinase